MIGRYIRIDSLTSADPLNLAEVQAFDGAGAEITAVSAALSTEHAAGPASNCVDSDLTNFCHSDSADLAPWLQVDFGEGAAFQTITVTNRADYLDQIVGARISIRQDASGIDVLWSSTFRGEASSYSWTLPTSTTLHTASCCKAPCRAATARI